LYDEVEDLAIRSKNIFTVERLNNIWQLLLSLSRTTNYVPKDFLDRKTQSLTSLLNSFKNDETVPSAALQAEVMLCFMDLAQHKDDPVLTSGIFEVLRTLLIKANTMIGFPFESFFEILTDLDSAFGGDINYENLQETLIELETKRRGEIPAAELLLKRGIQHLNSERIYKAIDSFGRALGRFYKQESKDQLVKSLYLLSIAYEEAGLLWAARGALLNAAAYATSDLWTYSRINAMQLSCFERLAIIELRLGRVGYALEWYELFSFLSSQIIKTSEEEDKFIEKFDHFDSILGLLLIKTPDYDLPSLEKLPDTLLSMRLEYSAWGLLYRLGGKELLPESFLTKRSENEIAQFFNLWLSQPGQKSLPSVPDFYMNDTVELKSRILGCDYAVRTVNSSPEIELAEYIIAALESLLSTAIQLSAIATDSDALVTISRDDSLPNGIQYTQKDDGRIHIAVTCKEFNPHILSKIQQEEIYAIVSEIVLFITGHSVMFKDANKDLKVLFKEEEVSSRAFNFSSPLVALGNVLGSNPKRSIFQWIKEDVKIYSFSSENSGKPIKEEELDSTPTSKKLESSLPRHDEIKNISIIRQHLWEAAGWEGVSYIIPSSKPPILAFLFNDEAKAKAIFEDWKQKFGEQDYDEIIRITMVRGIYKKNPTWYRALVTTNFEPGKPTNEEVFTATRIHTLTPETTINLDRFVESFDKYGIYLFAPAIYDKAKSFPNVFIKWGIVKREFIEKNAWEIDLNDIDRTAITSDADPILPSDIKDAPVLKVLQQIKKK
jgi:tetratricopeptide (TPR) repeat protein